MVRMRHVPQRLMYLNPWSLADSPVWKGYGSSRSRSLLEDVQEQAWEFTATPAFCVCSHRALSPSTLLLPSLCAPPTCSLRKLRWNRSGSGCSTFSPTTTIGQNTMELYCTTEKQLTLRDHKLFKLIILPQKLYHLIWWSSKRINEF